MAGRWSSPRKKAPRPTSNDEPGATPSLIEPQLPTLVNRAPSDGEWSYEIKFDGYRMLGRVENGAAQLVTRSGHDWTDRMPKLRDALSKLPVDNAWVDGEAVVLNSAGMPDFNALQNAFDRHSTAQITLFLFDLMYVNDTDIREEPLRARRSALQRLMDEVETDVLRFSEDFAQDPASLVASACKMKLEGIIGKRADAPYRSGRSTDWVKLKCMLCQEFVIGGISRVKGAKTGVRSWLLGVHERDGSLRFAGTAKPQLRPSQITALQRKAGPLAKKTSPFYTPPSLRKIAISSGLSRSFAQISFVEWSPAGEVRHPVFHGMRDDKPADDVTEEPVVDVEDGEPVEAQSGSTRVQPGRRGNVTLAGQKISNAERESTMSPVSGR
jgi:bifunctional non-homologous end joining protein LigD